MKYFINDGLTLSPPPEGPLTRYIIPFADWLVDRGYGLVSLRNHVLMAAGFTLRRTRISRKISASGVFSIRPFRLIFSSVIGASWLSLAFATRPLTGESSMTAREAAHSYSVNGKRAAVGFATVLLNHPLGQDPSYPKPGRMLMVGKGRAHQLPARSR